MAVRRQDQGTDEHGAFDADKAAGVLAKEGGGPRQKAMFDATKT